MFFFVITKNINWKILTKNLVTFKRWDGVKDEKFEPPVHWKIWFLGRCNKKPIYRRGLPIKGGQGWGEWAGQFLGLRGRGLGEKEGGDFEGGLIPQCTIWVYKNLAVIDLQWVKKQTPF